MTKGAVWFCLCQDVEASFYLKSYEGWHTKVEDSGGRDGALEGEGRLGLGGAELLGGGLGWLD